MKTLNGIFLLGLMIALPQPAHTGSAGAEPFNFLFLDANARAVGLSGAYTALATDSNALLYNHAGLGNIRNHQATFMHNQYFQDITQEYLAYASPKGWGASFNYLSFGDIKNTTLSNKTGAGLGSFGVTDMAISAGYGQALYNNLSVGAGIKFIKESIDNISGEGFALDLGTLYTVPMLKGLTIGAAVHNIGPPVTFQSAKERMPLAIRLGTAYSFIVSGQSSLISLDLVKERSEDVLAGLGIETIVSKSFPIRLGYNTRNDDGPGITAGLGYLYNNLSFDYAFAPFKELGAAHRLSVTLLWGKDNVPPSPKPALKINPVPAPIAAEVKAEAVFKAIQEVKQTSGIEIEERTATNEMRITATEKAIYFNKDSSDIKKEIYPLLDTIAELILAMQSNQVEIFGHTDSQGDAAFNNKLSNTRAQAVLNYFIERRGVPKGIFHSFGHGSSVPVASNSTLEGRSRNRRVEIVIHK